jgi:DNA-3-methyladenine glycosylase
MTLPKSFYQRSAVEVARDLVGKLLVHKSAEGITAGMIVETEAYVGSMDKACHAYKGKTDRNAVMFRAGGLAYVYFIYGMYNCFNVVSGPKNVADAVLIRALEPVQGLALMSQRRYQKNIWADLSPRALKKHLQNEKLTAKEKNLTNGPGKLCQALDITKTQYGANLTRGELLIKDYKVVEPTSIGVSKRINIDYAEEARDFPWRFYLLDNPWVSRG